MFDMSTSLLNAESFKHLFPLLTVGFCLSAVLNGEPPVMRHWVLETEKL